ncbi:MAG: 1-phosphofructokinase family hexose kinase, partial [Clostridia bacterium]|nr:1-phosphofructokinase family hexose kinase [Clostridia bacterium]
GKGLNVARVAHILGEKAAAMGFIGGFNGEYIKSELQKLGIKTEFTRVNGETRICVNISDRHGLSGEILERGPEVGEKEKENFIKTFESHVAEYDIICASGSLPQGIDSSLYCEIIRIAKENSKRAIVDASGKVLEDVIRAKPFMIKPNRYELSLLMKCEINSLEDVKKALIFLRDSGIELPLITLGKDGAMAYTDNTFYKFNSPVVKVKNTVGSGDSSVAGIATGLRRGMNVIDSVKLGMAAGTANTQFEETGMVSCELVEKYYKEITVEKC